MLHMLHIAGQTKLVKLLQFMIEEYLTETEF